MVVWKSISQHMGYRSLIILYTAYIDWIYYVYVILSYPFACRRSEYYYVKI